jgi:signal transduction histidine kinase/DNA-binding response OmpR family regulator
MHGVLLTMITWTGLSMHFVQSYMERALTGWDRLVSARQLWIGNASALSGPALILPGIAVGVAAALVSIALLHIRTRREMRKLRQELAAQAARVKAAEAATVAKTEFLGSVSHQIRTPLNAIQGFTQLALNADLAPQLREYLDTVRASADCLMHTVNDVLEFSELEAGTLTLENLPFSPSECILSALKMVEREAQAKKLVTASKIDPQLPPMVRGDATRLRYVVFHLLDNAVKFTARGSLLVRAALGAAGTNDVLVRITVTDTGLGIPLSEQPFLFEPFHGNPNLKARASALGLAVSRRLVELMGGSMTFQSQLGAGSTFEFTARFEKAKKAEVESVLHAPESAAGESAVRALEPVAGQQRSILIVDDDAVSRQLVTKVLESAGHRVWAAANGEEALHLTRTEAFDLIFMDLEMPDLDGLQVTREIRKNEAPGLHVPIYALTAHASISHRESCMEAGMDGFLTKPVPVDEILQLLSKLARSAAGATDGDVTAQCAGNQPIISPEQGTQAADAIDDDPGTSASDDVDLAPHENEPIFHRSREEACSIVRAFDPQAIWKIPVDSDDTAAGTSDDTAAGTQELLNLAVEASRDPTRTEGWQPSAGDSCGRNVPAALPEPVPVPCAVREVDLPDPFVQARRALYKSRFDVRVIHNNGDPSDRNLI